VVTASCVYLYGYINTEWKPEFDKLVIKAVKAKKKGDLALAADLFEEAVLVTTALPPSQQAAQHLIFTAAYECSQLNLTVRRPDQAETCLRKALAACQR
jgi:hypothetical protein